MTQTKQKRVKFSKGEISARLQEREDAADLIHSSAKFIENYAPTIYGGIRKRFGTNLLREFEATQEVSSQSIIKTFSFYKDGIPYILLIEQDTLKIFDEQGNLLNSWTDSDFTSSRIPEIKMSSTDDRCVFTHQEFPPKELAFSTAGGVPVTEMLNAGMISTAGEQPSTTANSVILVNDATIYPTLNIGDTQTDFYIDLNTAITTGFYRIQYEVECTNSTCEVYADYGGTQILIATHTGSGNYTYSNTYTQPINNLRFVFTMDAGILPNENSGVRYVSVKQLDNSWSNATFGNIVFDTIPYIETGLDTRDAQTYTISSLSGLEGMVSFQLSPALTDYNGRILDGGNTWLFRIRILGKSGSTYYGYTSIPFLTTATQSGNFLLTNYDYAWGATRGYPACSCFFQERLFFAGVPSLGSWIFGSRTGAYYDFGKTKDLDTDAVWQNLSGGRNLAIKDLYVNDGIQIFSTNDELVGLDSAITPNGQNFKQNSQMGSYSVEPANVQGMTVFVGKDGNSLLGFTYNWDSQKYSTPILTHLTENLVKHCQRIAFYPTNSGKYGNYLIGVNEDGTGFLGNILLESEIQSFARLNFDNGKLIDVQCIDNDVYFFIKRFDEISQSYKIYMEQLDWDTEIDCRTTVTQLSQGNIVLNGGLFTNKTVGVYNSNGYLGNYDVDSNNTITGDFEVGLYYVGFPVYRKLKTNWLFVNENCTNIHKRLTMIHIETYNTNKEILKVDGVIPYFEDGSYILNAVTQVDSHLDFEITAEKGYDEIIAMYLYINYGD